MQLIEDENDDDSVSAIKYNECQRQARTHKEEVEWRVHKEAKYHQAEEQQRVEAERCRAKEQAKKCISHFWLVMIELMVLDGGGCCATVW